MTHWLSNDIVVGSVRLHYYRTGGDKPPVVLAHGITDNGLCWTRVAQVLEKAYDVVMMDARGHGRSQVTETGYTPAQRAADLAGLIERLGLDRPALIGHSMGADTSAVTAATYPDLVGCVVLEDPPWAEAFRSAAARKALAGDWQARILARKAFNLTDLIAAGRVEHPGWHESEIGPWAEAKLQVSLAVRQGLTELRPYWADMMARLTCPALLITADPDLGALVTPTVVAEVTGRCPQLKVAHLAGAGHSIHREQFEPFIEVVTAFLAEVQA